MVCDIHDTLLEFLDSEYAIDIEVQMMLLLCRSALDVLAFEGETCRLGTKLMLNAENTAKEQRREDRSRRLKK